MFCGMVNGAAGDADQAANRGIVHYRAALLLAHLQQLILHTEPNTPKINRVHAIKLFAGGVGRFCRKTLHTRVVECSIQASEYRDGLRNHSLHLRLIRHIAADGNCLMSGGDQVFRRLPNRRFIDVNEHDSSTLRRKHLRCGQAHARASASNECHFVLKR